MERTHLVVSPVTGSVISGPQQPATSTPPRPLRSARRTSTIDTTRPDGVLGRTVIEGMARDLVTSDSGRARVAAVARVRLVADGTDRSLLELETDPAVDALAQLRGALVGPGFRAKVDALVPYSEHGAAPLLMLLDDVPGAALVSGYAQLHQGAFPTRPVPDQFLDAQVDLCAGWAGDASMMQMIRATGQNPTPLGPVAPDLLDPDDPDAWHARPELPPHSMRRARRLDVIAPAPVGAPYRVDAYFRDSHMDGAGEETVVHEYGVIATVDPATRTLLTVAATAHVLPWQECPQAVASAGRLVGQPVADLRRVVRREFTGTSTCTHLNDVLRLLADVEFLAAELD